MPFDITTNNFSIPENFDFEVEYEPSKVPDKKYVKVKGTDTYLNVVGNGFTTTSHTNFAHTVWNTMQDKLSVDELEGMTIDWKSARNDGYMMMDITLPSVSYDIYTDKHSEKIGQRIIGLHGVDGLCSNIVVYGQISFFCTNKMVRGEHDIVKRKNTSNFCIDGFGRQLEQASTDFYDQANTLQQWANTSTVSVDVKALFEKIMSDTQAEKMYSLYGAEVSTRGANAYSIYSAFTNYASYADERNGFKLRNTGKDTEAVSMWNRELDVTKWVKSKQFQNLVAV